MPGGSGLALTREQAELHRLRGDYLLRSGKEEDAFQEYQEAQQALEIARKEVMLSVQKLGTDGPSDDSQDVFLPVLHAMILKQQGKAKWLIWVRFTDADGSIVWLLRDELGEEYTSHLEQLLALPQLPHVEVSSVVCPHSESISIDCTLGPCQLSAGPPRPLRHT